ncbi:Selenocysteine lyase/Cysteine desulfurase [Amycolatopsis marina]|uniref:Selenocysteine lyase/Cysteine desulfurase n=1 Tax=Amycolatopsis marina TaxID=490629 RepID=A0A1I1BZP5_9PSEU|nr:aminotransferase class V-fold PLP-dependent enzyme [Amycolatopsis marina]SFB55874.1 Selenocysteine lyase/Cysteine desulfurase [Amycolatopsis marina]
MRTAFGARFDVPTGYLNTPSIGVPSAETAETVARSVQRWGSGLDDPHDFDSAVRTAREAFGRLIGVPGERIASGATVSQLVSMVAAGLPEGARVLAARGEFTSVTFPFAALQARGVTVTEVDLAELPGHVAGHDLVAVSVVQSADGAIVDLAALRAEAEAAAVPVLLDATQAAGWLPLRLDWADWVVGAAYKWLLAPRGAAWMAVRPEALGKTVPLGANWYAGAEPWQSVYGLPLRLAGSARRLDLSPAWLAQVGAAAALPYLASLDAEAVRAHCVGLADLLLGKLGLPPRGSAIVSLGADELGAAKDSSGMAALTERLSEAGVRASVRAGRTRVGFHLYSTAEDVELMLDAIS